MAIRTVIEEKRDGAHIPGIFLQGPYTSHEITLAPMINT